MEKEIFRRYDDVKGLSTLIGKKSSFVDLLQDAFFFSGVSGAIAIVITLAICYVYVVRPDAKIPDLFANALTMILGFYFGTAVQKAASKDK